MCLSAGQIGGVHNNRGGGEELAGDYIEIFDTIDDQRRLACLSLSRQ